MTSYRLITISPHILQEVRQTYRSPGYGHPVYGEIAHGYGPCRSCLRFFKEGKERRLLFTYDPFINQEPFPLPGPVFIHEQPCLPHKETDRFPEELRAIPLTLNAYKKGRRLIAQEHIIDGGVELVAAQLFKDPEVAYIHLRNTKAGCYIVQLNRKEDAQER